MRVDQLQSVAWIFDSCDISENELVDLTYKQKNISKHLNKDKIKKIIYIKNKLINIIIHND